MTMPWRNLHQWFISFHYWRTISWLKIFLSRHFKLIIILFFDKAWFLLAQKSKRNKKLIEFPRIPYPKPLDHNCRILASLFSQWVSEWVSESVVQLCHWYNYANLTCCWPINSKNVYYTKKSIVVPVFISLWKAGQVCSAKWNQS